MIALEELQDYITSLLAGTGINLVHLAIAKKDRLLNYQLVIYRSQGTGIDDCTRVHRMVVAALTEKFGHDNFYMEVTSPGIDWTFKSRADYSIFAGRGVLVTMADGTASGGVLVAADTAQLRLMTAEGELLIPFSQINGCKLDVSREGR